MAHVKKISKKQLGSFSMRRVTAIEELLAMSDDAVTEASFDSEEQEEVYTAIESDDFDIGAIIEAELDSFNPLPRDMRIDDSRIPRARNFYQFAKDETFLNSTPYLEQALIATKLLAEYCPHCSDTEWMEDDGHEADEGLAMLEARVTFLHNGVCPECGARKTDLIKEGSLQLYNELAVCAGQRCVVGSTLIPSSEGLTPARHFMEQHNLSLFNGNRLEQPSRYFKSPNPELIYTVRLASGIELSGTFNHPIYVKRHFLDKEGDWTELQQLTSDMRVIVRVGARVYGKNDHFDSIYGLLSCTETVVSTYLDHHYSGVQCRTTEEAQYLGQIALNDGRLPHIQGKFVSWTPYRVNFNTMEETFEVFKCEEKQYVYDFTLPSTHQFITNGLLSHNSGKSAVTTMIAAYILHRYLMIGKPTDMIGIRSNEILHGTFIALTAGQAKGNLWDPFYLYLSDSPWFRTYHAFLKYQESRLGEQLFKLKETFVIYRHRNLYWYPAAPDKRVLRGRTRVLGAIDELGWFDANRDSGKVKDNAHEVYKALSNSLATARQSEKRLVDQGFDMLLTGYMINVSSPSSIRDKIVELVRISKNSKKILGLHKPTWKMNPHLPRDSDLITEEFRKDPIGAARDFGAEPALSSYPFIPNVNIILDSVKEKSLNFVKYRLRTESVGRGKNRQIFRTADILNIKKGVDASVLAMDAGLVNNSFSLACGTKKEDGEVHLDVLVEILPMPGVSLSYTRIFSDVIVPIIQARNVKILLADRWNSVKLLQDALDIQLGLEVSKQYSLKYVDMCLCRDSLDQGVFKIPYVKVDSIEEILDHNPDDYPRCFEYKPVEHLMLQLATVQDAGKKQVIKGDGFTDDSWRAAALMHWALRNPEYAEILATKAVQNRANYMASSVRKMSSLGGKGISGGGTKRVGSTAGFLGVKKSMR